MSTNESTALFEAQYARVANTAELALVEYRISTAETLELACILEAQAAELRRIDIDLQVWCRVIENRAARNRTGR